MQLLTELLQSVQQTKILNWLQIFYEYFLDFYWYLKLQLVNLHQNVCCQYQPNCAQPFPCKMSFAVCFNASFACIVLQ